MFTNIHHTLPNTLISYLRFYSKILNIVEKMRGILISLIFVLGVILISQVGHCYGQLKVGFYHGKCGEKNVENVIYDVVKQKIASDPDTVSDLVRLSFHDCFIRVRTCIIVYHIILSLILILLKLLIL